MAVTKAIPEGEEQKDHVGLGASGGFAPEGYGLRRQANVIDEDVAHRSKEEEDKRTKEAEEFQQGKKKAIEDAKDPEKAAKTLEKQQKVQDEKSTKKPTAPGAHSESLASGVGTHDAKTTEKLEKQTAPPAPEKK